MKFIILTVMSTFFVLPVLGMQNTGVEVIADSTKYLPILEEYASNVLRYGKDEYGDTYSSLLADGVNVITKEPVRWEFGDNSFILSNFASQQNLLRFLVGLSNLTGNPMYKEKAELATKYMFEHHSDKSGLLYWGGHQFVDLLTMQNHFKDRPHELKSNFPFYEFMWEVDSVATRKMLRAIWNTHILNWEKLDLNRHGEYDKEMGSLWDHEFVQRRPFFEGEGLTFINAGTDMIHVALSLYMLGNEKKAEEWGLRLYEQYVRARNDSTNLGVYQYSRPTQTDIPPDSGELRGELTFSKYGDRARNQFWATYGEIALEGNVLWGSRMQTLYGQSPVMLFYLADKLKETEAGDKLKKWAIEGLNSYADYAYDFGHNRFKPMWTDGTDLSGEKIPRTGYYGLKGNPFPFLKPDGPMIMSFTKGAILSGRDSNLWQVARNMLKHEGIGDIGNEKILPSLNFDTENSNTYVLIALLDIYEYTKEPDFLKIADRIGANILKDHYFEGVFVPSKKHIYASFDAPQALALLILEATKVGKRDIVSPYLTGSGSTDGEPITSGGYGRHSDEDLYKLTTKNTSKPNQE